MPRGESRPRGGGYARYHRGMTLALEGVGFGFGGTPVLRGLTCAFPPGVVTAVVGPNGAGTSTLLRLLLGTLRPGAGWALHDGRDVASYAPRTRAAGVAYIPQRSEVAFAFSVREVVALGRYHAGRGGSEAAVGRALEAVGLADRAEAPYGTLSAGQQQRATVARALAQVDGRRAGARGTGGASPTPAILADEPVAAMDPAHALRTLDLLAGLAAEGFAVVVVLHDLALALRSATRAVVIGPSGTALAEGPVAEALTPATAGAAYGGAFRALADPATGRTLALLPVGPGVGFGAEAGPGSGRTLGA